MHRTVLRLLAIFAAAGLFGLAPARAAPPHIQPLLLADSAAVPGQPVTLAVLMQPAPGWHGYWLNPGDAGLPLMVDWTVSRRQHCAAALSGAGHTARGGADEPCLRARLRGPDRAERATRCRARDCADVDWQGAMAGLHRQDLCARTSRIVTVDFSWKYLKA